jgi:Zn ribbon nucleic-acid-binding protein/site-specific recombinase XerD
MIDVICESCGQKCLKQRDGDKALCRGCHDNKMKQLWRRSSLKKAECVSCGAARPTSLLKEDICQSCYTRRKNGVSRCQGKCGKDKIIVNLQHHLCKHCYADMIADDNLRSYLDRYSSPFSKNKYYFALLAEVVDWNGVTEKTVRRYRAIGEFLREHALPEKLTWEAVEEILPPVERVRRYKTKLIRSCLRDIGQLLAERGQLETRAAYISRRRSLQPIAKAPAQFRNDLLKYLDWLTHDKYSPSSIRSSLCSIVCFLSWCDERGISSFSKVQILTVESYQQTLYWKWFCKSCKHTIPFEPWEDSTPEKTCRSLKCTVSGTYVRHRRHSQAYIRTQTSNLFTFFTWAEYNQLVHSNPVQCRVRENEAKVTHYSEQVFEKLFAYLKSPQADPEEALALYLILLHAFRVAELRLAQIPPSVPPAEGQSEPSLTENYRLLIAPQPRPRANNAGRRPDLQIDFPLEAVQWLKPLLKRYEQHRASIGCNPRNNYLFISSQSARHLMPVSKEYIRRLVSKATCDVLGAAANASALRRTAGVIFADECPRRGAVLTRLGWGEQRANGYTFMRRRLIHPRCVPVPT